VSETATPGIASSTAAPPTFFARHHFLLRRLHSLSGIVPVGLFVITHLFTNFQLAPAALGKKTTFQHEVEFIHGLPALLFVEIGLWLGIGFHAALGLVYTFADNNKMGVPESASYRYQASWRYTLQRVTGIIALLFIFIHVATLRWGWTFGGAFETFYVFGPNKEPLSAPSTALALQSHWSMPVLYAIGTLSIIYHWANGLWTAAITWGLTVSVAAMRRWGYVCTALFVVLFVFGAGAIAGALRLEVTDEQRAAYRQAQQMGGGSHEHDDPGAAGH
jgi:succinate dehydrogenase / fumarate reductase, cytochrome b subunit